MSYESKDRDLQGLIDASYKIGMAQHADEIVPFAEAVKNELKPRLILEIGSHKGGTAALWLGLVSAGGGVYSIDLPQGPWGGIPHAHATARNAILSVLADSHGVTFAGHLGDSHAVEAQVFAQGACDAYGQFYDMVFIDGDHSYEGVKRDFDMALALVRDGGWIVLHDVIDGPIHDRDHVEVPRFWKELADRHGRFLDSKEHAIIRTFIGTDGYWGGLGVVIA